MKKIFMFFVFLSFLLISCSRIEPYSIAGVSDPVISLDGIWKLRSGRYDDSTENKLTEQGWKEIMVPGEPMMQGYPVKHNQPFLYAREVEVPDDYRDKRIKIRFEGVYSYARVWINNNFIRDHSGGFTPWECDITGFADPGEKTTLFVEVTDMADEVSYASGYAKHQIGGILRSVSLLALPSVSVEKVVISTDLDDYYENSTLVVKGKLNDSAEYSEIRLSLIDPLGKLVELEKSDMEFSGREFTISNKVIKPLKWDAEHPNLYTLRLRYLNGGKECWARDFRVGFREIEIRGNSFLVNGSQVKLRGACRHDIHPLLGRMTTPDLDLKDVLLAKEANINFIRTSHYPPSEMFLHYCDEYGIYVEDETAVCFVGSHRTAEYYPGNSESSPDYTEKYLSQLEEMVDNHRNHPSVIMWSIGNENTFGNNFLKSYEWVKQADPSRPVIYSYPGQVPDSVRAYDVISMHYPGTGGTMEQYGMRTYSFGHPEFPVIFDEWAHVPCYNQETVMEDPNVRDFWGISLDSMWQRAFEASGGLGGAIWGMIDETFMLPDDLPGYNEWWGKLDPNVIPAKFSGHTVGYGEWGFIDTWRRKKPEFWSVKKAYSPVRILKTEGYDFTTGTEIKIPVYNRFDHTNLNEINLTLKAGNRSFKIPLPEIAPHGRGEISIDNAVIAGAKSVKLEFFDRKGNLIDMYLLNESVKPFAKTGERITGRCDMKEDNNEIIIVCGGGVSYRIDKSTGLFTSFLSDGEWKNFKGPHMNYMILGREKSYSAFSLKSDWGEWKRDLFSVDYKTDSVIITSSGKYGNSIAASFRTVISYSGRFITTYSFSGLPAGYVREAGILFSLAEVFDTLKWNRSSYWKGYPADHLSAETGAVSIHYPHNRKYRNAPENDWQYDKKSFFYNGTENEITDDLTNIARSTKENIFTYSLISGVMGSVEVSAEGDKSCRIKKRDGSFELLINDYVDYPDISWGNYSRNRHFDGVHSGTTSISVR